MSGGVNSFDMENYYTNGKQKPAVPLNILNFLKFVKNQP